MLTSDQFAESIKKKYPQYAGVDNATLTQKMLAKYPQYQSKVTTAPTAPQAPDNRDFLQKATDVVKHSPFSIAVPLGEAVGRSVGAIGESIKQHSLDPLLKAGEANNANYGKVVGSAIGSAALPASLAASGGASSILNSVPRAAPIASALSKKPVLDAALGLGGLAAVSGGAESLAEGNDLKTAAIDSFKSGLTGAAIGGAVKVAGNAVQKVTQNAPDHLYNNSLKVLQKIKTAGKSPADFLKQEGVWGNLGTFKKAAQEGMAAENAAIKAKVAKLSGGATYNEIRKSAITSLKGQLGNLYSDKQIAQMVDDVPVAKLKQGKIVNWNTLDDVRSSLGSLIGDGKWLSANPTEKVKASQAVYRAMAGLLQKTSGTEAEFARYSKWIQTNKVVDRAIGLADSKYGLGLYDAISGTGGAVVGFGSGDDVGERLKNAAIGGATGLAIERGINSPAIKTGVAQVLTHIGDLPTDSLGRVSRAAVVDLIGRLMATNPEDQQTTQ